MISDPQLRTLLVALLALLSLSDDQRLRVRLQLVDMLGEEPDKR